MMRSLLLFPLFFAGAASTAPPGRASPPSTAPADPTSTGQAKVLKVGRDANDRMTVAVRVSNSGPYRFLVDTGAERTVISRQLADQLRLTPGSRVRMQSVAGASDVATVDIPALDVDTRRVPVTGAPTLDAVHIGADGVLGVDSLASTRVLFDFKRGVMDIRPSREDHGSYDPLTIVVEARRRHGRLMFTHAVADGTRTVVVIDTGSQVTIGNAALRERLLGRRRLGKLTEMETVAGEKLIVELATVQTLDLDGVVLRRMAIAFTDGPVFRQLDLDQRPAMLLGMNALRGFEKVSIDFATRRVRFVLPETGSIREFRLASR